MRTPMDPRTLRTRDPWQYEEVLEVVLGVPYPELLRNARAFGCGETDLIQLGRGILGDLVHLARGEISTIRVPARLPFGGEYAD